MQVGDLIKCIDGGLCIVSAVSEKCIYSGAWYADLIDAVTFESGMVIRIDNNPNYEIVSSPNHSKT